METHALLTQNRWQLNKFCAKLELLSFKLFGRSLYVLEPDSSIPAVFFGMSGFNLEDLRRIVLSEAPLDASSKPLCPGRIWTHGLWAVGRKPWHFGRAVKTGCPWSLTKVSCQSRAHDDVS